MTFLTYSTGKKKPLSLNTPRRMMQTIVMSFSCMQRLLYLACEFKMTSKPVDLIFNSFSNKNVTQVKRWAKFDFMKTHILRGIFNLENYPYSTKMVPLFSQYHVSILNHWSKSVFGTQRYDDDWCKGHLCHELSFRNFTSHNCQGS